MLNKLYQKLVLDHPWLSLFITLAVVGLFCTQIPKFKLDASADSLVLENDQALRYYRHIVSQYGSSDYLVLTFSPKQDLFSDASLETLKKINNDLTNLSGVESVFNILNAPLLFSPPTDLGDLSDKINTLENPSTDKALAHTEFLTNPIYKNQLLSADGKTTAILINLPAQPELRALLKRRTELRQKESPQTISNNEKAELHQVEKDYRRLATKLTQEQDKTVADIRLVMNKYRDQATMYLGGVPMIVNDMISYVRNDILIFGIGVFAFLIITMSIIFRRIRWIVIPMLCCCTAALTMVGALGFMDWRVTVISSNFISLMLIITMSLTIHLIVKYRELCVEQPQASQKELLAETVSQKVIPCFYTTLTTIAAFVSLLVSSIRPVMDFGLMMSVGLIVSFILSFLLFPAAAMLLKRENITMTADKSAPFTMFFASFTKKHGKLIIVASITLTILSAMGISRLVVENRFIDYFRESTEIYQGMKLIDQKLGGTTPLDIIIDFHDQPSQDENNIAENSSLNYTDELLLDDFDNELVNDTSPKTSKDSTWFTSYKMERLEKVHNYLDSLPETGKVLSISTLIKIATRLNDGIGLDDYELAILYDKLPENVKDLLVKPYVSFTDNQARITMRVMESNKKMSRKNLLAQIHNFLTQEMHFAPEQIHFTNMFILYNNMLQSLFRSQILTIGAVFLCIMFMFTILFRSLSLAAIALIPNLLPAAMILGTMGWIGLPLDLMTITIASITIGIAVDDTIHYIHRFRDEFQKDHNYIATMERCHGSIGKAMYYTSLTIVIGFSILVSSNFKPTIYFGIFTGFAMIAALLAALTLLPKLLILWKPFGPGTEKT